MGLQHPKSKDFREFAVSDGLSFGVLTRKATWGDSEGKGDDDGQQTHTGPDRKGHQEACFQHSE